MVNITVINNDISNHFKLEHDENIGDFLRKHKFMPSVCNIGKCGKCLIYANSTPTNEEILKLGKPAIQKGLRLSCYTKAFEGLEIRIIAENAMSVLTNCRLSDYEYEPLINIDLVNLPKQTLVDNRDDLRRLVETTKLNAKLSFAQLNLLASICKKNSDIYISHDQKDIINISKEKQKYFLVVDIGTTTVAAFLVDLSTGKISHAKGEHNAQSPFGADVISRINYCMKHGVKVAKDAIITQINFLLQALLEESEQNDVNSMVFTGNTSMLHMLCGLNPDKISSSPFIPITTKALQICAESLGINSLAPAFIMPSISAYIGGDIVAAMLAANAHHKQEPFLLLDLGTNAEIVLGYEDKFLMCSAAAGPCFEGANLSSGMAGKKGAIDTFFLENNKLKFTTIDNSEAEGICGSGVLDLLAILIETKTIDKTGKIVPEQSIFNQDIEKIEKVQTLKITEKVSFTQKDIREIQLAKAAVFAGIKVLLNEANLDINDIKSLYLAGGFGSNLKPSSAAKIGLFPSELQDKCKILGNAAGFGALRYLTEKNAMMFTEEIISKSFYIELSAHEDFSKIFMNCMAF